MKMDKVQGDKASRGQRDNVQFELSAEPGSKVYVAGTFNNWSPNATPMTHHPESGHFRASLHLPKGRYEYKFIMNGIWVSDPHCAERAPNELGSLNSVIHV